jgi:drug/metabolite transporter (DMT)-like permease
MDQSERESKSLTSEAVNWSLMLLCALIWGFSYYLIKHSLIGFSPVQVAGLRISSAALSLLPFAVLAFRRVPRNKYGPAILCAVIGNGLPMFLYPLAQTHISSSITGIINSLTPLCVYFCGILFFGLPGNKQKLSGVLMGLAGVVCLIIFKPQTELRADLFFFAVALCVPVFYGFNANIYKKHLGSIAPVPLTSWMFFVLFVPASFVLFVTDAQKSMITEAGLTSLPYALMLGVFGTALAMTLFNILLKRANIMFAASISYLMPVVAVTLGMLDDESVRWYEIAGLALILFGVLLINKVKPAEDN